MECLSYRFTLLLLLTVSTFTAFKAQEIVTDPQTTAQVLLNMGMQMEIEKKHNEYLDTIESKQEEILLKSSLISIYKENHLRSRQNTKGFDAESLYYKEIALTSSQILDLSVNVLKALKESNMPQKANAVIVVADLTGRCTSLVNDFINIVTNCTAKHPLSNRSDGNVKSQKDSHNILDRDERMKLAGQISLDLKKIKFQLDRLFFVAQYGDWNLVLKNLDPVTWAQLLNGKITSERLISQWKSTVK